LSKDFPEKKVSPKKHYWKYVVLYKKIIWKSCFS
jgi:hypothetical protein